MKRLYRFLHTPDHPIAFNLLGKMFIIPVIRKMLINHLHFLKGIILSLVKNNINDGLILLNLLSLDKEIR